MALLGRGLSRSQLLVAYTRPCLAGRGLSRSQLLVAYTRPCLAGRLAMSSSAEEEQSRFWEKNKQLNRPVSPHLTIYQPQITSMMSFTHRATGVGLTGGLTVFALTVSILPGDYASYLSLVHSWSAGPALIGLAKLFIAWPFCFHTLNGLRHLMWDMGYGFNLKSLYRSGWLVLSLSLVTGIAIAAL